MLNIAAIVILSLRSPFALPSLSLRSGFMNFLQTLLIAPPQFIRSSHKPFQPFSYMQGKVNK